MLNVLTDKVRHRRNINKHTDPKARVFIYGAETLKERVTR